jgi:DNA repair exonuclease SbcCD nuclease subunit
VKLIHAADLHIDSPLRGLSVYEGAPAEELRTASRRALQNLVQLAISESVDGVLLAGDIYDGDWPDFQTGLFFGKQMSLLRAEGIAVYLVSGNHDAQNKMTRQLPLPDNVHMLDVHEPETVRNEKIGLAVHGQGFPRWDITDNLALGYPPPCRDLFNVGLLHTALNGRDGHNRYAPCTVDHLRAKGYDYWALGHVHNREVVLEDPWIVFPGNIQGRHARETGPKGCTLVTVGDDQHVRSAVHHDLDVARWEHLRIDVSETRDLDAVADLVQDRLSTLPSGKLQAVRISLTGRSSAHLALWNGRHQFVNEIRSLANDLGQLWVEKVRIETRLPDTRDDGTVGLLADLRRTAALLRTDTDALRQMVTRDFLYTELPTEVRSPDGIRPAEPEWLQRLGDEAIDLLESMLTEGRNR